MAQPQMSEQLQHTLCFGDSNTWGFVPGSGERFPFDVRWPGVLQRELGPAYRVIEEGLNGRMTRWADPDRPGRNAADYFHMTIESHRPLALVVIMLGINEILRFKHVKSYDAAEGVGELVDIARAVSANSRQKVLVVAPPSLGNLSAEILVRCQGRPEDTAALPAALRRMAQDRHAFFWDASAVVSAAPLDGLHLAAEGHRTLGVRLAQEMRQLGLE